MPTFPCWVWPARDQGPASSSCFLRQAFPPSLQSLQQEPRSCRLPTYSKTQPPLLALGLPPPIRKLSESGSGGWLVACVRSHSRGSFLAPKVAQCLHGLSWILGAGPLLQPSPPNWSPILRPLQSLHGLCVPALCRSLAESRPGMRAALITPLGPGPLPSGAPPGATLRIIYALSKVTQLVRC